MNNKLSIQTCLFIFNAMWYKSRTNCSSSHHVTVNWSIKPINEISCVSKYLHLSEIGLHYMYGNEKWCKEKWETKYYI